MVIVTGVYLTTVVTYRFGVQRSIENKPENSLSAYYHHTNYDWPMRDLFFGSLCAMGMLLVVYQGYRDAENIALDIGGIALICVAFFPMEKLQEGDKSWVAYVHYGSAVIFFLSIIYIVWFRAHDTLEDISEERRSYYKNTYRTTGLLMMSVVIVCLGVFVRNLLDPKFHPEWLLWAEWFGVFAFWVFWSAKTIEIENSKIDEKVQSQVKSAAQHTEGPRVY